MTGRCGATFVHTSFFDNGPGLQVVSELIGKLLIILTGKVLAHQLLSESDFHIQKSFPLPSQARYSTKSVDFIVFLGHSLMDFRAFHYISKSC